MLYRRVFPDTWPNENLGYSSWLWRVSPGPFCPQDKVRAPSRWSKWPLSLKSSSDFNDDIYYRNKLEYSQELGVLPFNIPFVFDFLVGDEYSQKPLHYTLVPIFPSLRWHMGKLSGPSILRGNTDLTVILSFTAIPRGPETRYGAFDLGVRRNFVQRNWRAAPYFEERLGAGFINASGPHGVRYGQGQDFTFTLMLGSGVRYNFNPRYSMAIGCSYMHVSNLYLSLPSTMTMELMSTVPWLDSISGWASEEMNSRTNYYQLRVDLCGMQATR